jgi:hypothetical protein
MTQKDPARTGLHPNWRRFLAFFVPSAVITVLGCLLLAGVVQQDLRQGGDDPQHQLAEDAVARLDAGDPPSAVVNGPTVDLATSLAPFVAIYDSSGNVLASNGALDGEAPVPPRGVLATAAQSGIDRVTWQPRPGVRSAIVVLRWAGGTVLAGRSLRRVEEIEANIERLALAGAVALTAVAAVAAMFAAWVWPRRGDEPAG